MWIFRQSSFDEYQIGYNENAAKYNVFGNFYTESAFVSIFTVNSMLKAIRLVNYLNGGDGTMNSMIEDICGE